MKRIAKPRAAMVHTLAFLVPVLGLLATYTVVGMHPFGEKSLLSIDMGGQYIHYFSYLRNQLLLGGESWLYTLSMALGGNMAGLVGYYLLSPFNLLLLLFPTAALPDAVLLITLIKTGVCGLTMSIFLNSRENSAKPALATLLFSVPYALMDYNIAFQQNIMWMEGVMLLPLVVLGIQRIVKGKSPLLYVLSLAASLITCYYIGYMLCIFSVLFFLVWFFCFGTREKGALKTRAGLGPVAGFGAGSLLAGGLSAAVLLPVVYSLQGGKVGFSAAVFFESAYANLSDVASRYVPGTAGNAVMMNYPHIYCGVLALLCAALYLLDKKVAKKQRVGMVVLLGVILVSFLVGPIDKAWHGFNRPVGFLYRFSFLFSFLLLFAGWMGFSRLRKSTVYRVAPAVAVGYFFVLLLARTDAHPYMTNGKFLLALGFAAAAVVLLWLFAAKKRRVVGLVLLLGLMLVDTGSNLYMGIRLLGYEEYKYFSGHVQGIQPVVQEIKEQEQGVYRMEELQPFSDNDAMLFGYAGLSHYSSADKVFVRDFLDRLGFSNGGYSVRYSEGSTEGMDHFFGIKYLLTSEPFFKQYQPAEDAGYRQVWYNNKALPLGFMAGQGVLAALPAAEEEPNLFAVQNRLWQAVTGQENLTIYRPAELEQTELDNLTVRQANGEDLYERVDGQQSGRLQFTLTAESDDMLYMLLTSENWRRTVYVSVNGVGHRPALTNDHHGILALGSFAPGTEVCVQIEQPDNEMFIGNTWFYYEDGTALEEVVASLAQRGFAPEAPSSSRFVGKVDNAAPAEAELLLITLPWDEGWHASVDGQPAEIQKAFGALMAIKVPAGQHDVRLWYVPPGLYAGCAVTAAALAALVAWLLLRRRAAGAKAPKSGAKTDGEAPAAPQS